MSDDSAASDKRPDIHTAFRPITVGEYLARTSRIDVDAELAHLRSQRDDLQASNTELVTENRELKARIAGRPVVPMVRVGANDLEPPCYAHPDDVGMDLRADLSGAIKVASSPMTVSRRGSSVTLAYGARLIIPCGFAFAIPDGFEGQVRPRSSVSRDGSHVGGSAGWEQGAWVQTGSIDRGYRGPVGVCFWYLGNEPMTIEHGQRIAQLVISPVASAVPDLVTSLPPAARGEGGFGSTGTK